VAQRPCRHRSRRLSEDFKIREGGAGDHAWVRDLGRRTVSSSVSALRDPSPSTVGDSFDRLVDFAFGQSHVLLVAEDGLERLGFVLFLDRLLDEVTGLPQAFVVYVAVEPHARRRGAGRRLMAAAESEARKRNLAYASFMVTEENDAARELYAQLGYQTERRQLCKRL
jgi:ribosomal protein S18 acetylase RimI-like enzyme